MKILRKIISSFLVITFAVSLILPPSMAQMIPLANLPAPGQAIALTSGFQPSVLKGMTVHPENPLLFDFIVDRGQDRLQNEQLKVESEKLIKYFLASMTIPDKDAWVNLSPYEKDRIIPNALGQTEMGRTMLEQDYILKQLSASLTNPDKELGQKFWNEVKSRAQKELGTSDVPLSTFNKVWIVPDGATVVEKDGFAYITESKLKVMLDQDFIAEQEGRSPEQAKAFDSAQAKRVEGEDSKVSNLSTAVFREMILPKLIEEVNTGKNFAQTRQVYQSVILAAWYKKALKDTLLGKIYVDQSKISGVKTDVQDIKQKVYEQYLAAFKKGVYNTIKEENGPDGDLIPRKYFSGGLELGMNASSALRIDNDPAHMNQAITEISQSGDRDVLVSSSTIETKQGADFLSSANLVKSSQSASSAVAVKSGIFIPPSLITLRDKVRENKDVTLPVHEQVQALFDLLESNGIDFEVDQKSQNYVAIKANGTDTLGISQFMSEIHKINPNFSLYFENFDFYGASDTEYRWNLMLGLRELFGISEPGVGSITQSATLPHEAIHGLFSEFRKREIDHPLAHAKLSLKRTQDRNRVLGYDFITGEEVLTFYFNYVQSLNLLNRQRKDEALVREAVKKTVNKQYDSPAKFGHNINRAYHMAELYLLTLKQVNRLVNALANKENYSFDYGNIGHNTTSGVIINTPDAGQLLLAQESHYNTLVGKSSPELQVTYLSKGGRQLTWIVRPNLGDWQSLAVFEKPQSEWTKEDEDNVIRWVQENTMTSVDGLRSYMRKQISILKQSYEETRHLYDLISEYRKAKEADHKDWEDLIFHEIQWISSKLIDEEPTVTNSILDAVEAPLKAQEEDHAEFLGVAKPFLRKVFSDQHVDTPIASSSSSGITDVPTTPLQFRIASLPESLHVKEPLQVFGLQPISLSGKFGSIYSSESLFKYGIIYKVGKKDYDSNEYKDGVSPIINEASVLFHLNSHNVTHVPKLLEYGSVQRQVQTRANNFALEEIENGYGPPAGILFSDLAKAIKEKLRSFDIRSIFEFGGRDEQLPSAQALGSRLFEGITKGVFSLPSYVRFQFVTPPYIKLQGFPGAESLNNSEAFESLNYHDQLKAFITLAEMYAEIHDAGVIHNDINPGNILVMKDKDGQLQYMIIDFSHSLLIGEEDEFNSRFFPKGEGFPNTIAGDIRNFALLMLRTLIQTADKEINQGKFSPGKIEGMMELAFEMIYPDRQSPKNMQEVKSRLEKLLSIIDEDVNIWSTKKRQDMWEAFETTDTAYHAPHPIKSQSRQQISMQAYEKADDPLPGIEVKYEGDWLLRGQLSEEVTERGILNVNITTELINELDQLLTAGVIKGYYKIVTPLTKTYKELNNAGVIIYFNSKPSEWALAKLNKITEKYLGDRSVFSGRKISDGFYMSEMGIIKTSHVAHLLEQISQFDRFLGKAMRYFLADADINRILQDDVSMSEEQYYAMKKGLNVVGMDVDYDREKGFDLHPIEPILPAASSAVNPNTSANSIKDSNVGGIDFNSSNLNLQIKRDGKGVPLPLLQQNIEQINIEGLYPVIINIQPINPQTFPILGQVSTSSEMVISKS